jgi:hypothetical protein
MISFGKNVYIKIQFQSDDCTLNYPLRYRHANSYIGFTVYVCYYLAESIGKLTDFMHIK